MSCRVLYVIGQLRPGGAERQLCYLLQAMDRDRYKPAVAVWNYRAEDAFVSHVQSLGVPLHPLPRLSSGYLRLNAFRRLIRQLRPELLHSYSFYTNFPAWWAVLGTQTVAIGALRSDFPRTVKKRGPLFGRLSARWPRSQIFNSRASAERAQGSKGLFVPRQLYIVRNGVDLQQFRAVPLSTAGRACVLGVGSLSAVKRWDRLLRAVVPLNRRGLDFQVRIVGDGPLREALQQQAQTLGVADCVEFMGQRNDIVALLARATFLVHTSDSEGCPNVVMEAMACGRAVVATGVGDTPFIVEHQKTGFVVPCGDDAALVERMATLISNRELCRHMGEASRLKAEGEFGLERLVSETLAAYRAAGWKDS
jgi:glycosyltransferase involved in cell wall biosynthesis